LAKLTGYRDSFRLSKGESYTCAVKGSKKDWHGHEVFGIGYQLDEVRDVISTAVTIHKQRSAHPDEQHEPIWVVIDDFPSVIRAIKKTHYDDLTLLLRDGRSTRIRLVLGLQGENVKTWGFDGESDLLEGFTRIRGGKFAIKEARSLVSRGELEQSDLDWLKLQDRPCLVEDQLAQI
jgi:hypothetical protein